jgi:hypothetical protein
VVGRHIAGDMYMCSCCSHVIELGTPAFTVVDRDDRELLVCSDCVGGP